MWKNVTIFLRNCAHGIRQTGIRHMSHDAMFQLPTCLTLRRQSGAVTRSEPVSHLLPYPPPAYQRMWQYNANYSSSQMHRLQKMMPSCPSTIFSSMTRNYIRNMQCTLPPLSHSLPYSGRSDICIERTQRHPHMVSTPCIVYRGPTSAAPSNRMQTPYGID